MAEWNDPVSDNGRMWFERKMEEHTRVRNVRAEGPQTYVIERKNMSSVRVWLCDVYTLGVADYEAIRAADPKIDAIVVLSIWNHYTPQVKAEGKGAGVGIFNPGELMSALHRDGDELVGD